VTYSAAGRLANCRCWRLANCWGYQSQFRRYRDRYEEDNSSAGCLKTGPQYYSSAPARHGTCHPAIPGHQGRRLAAAQPDEAGPYRPVRRTDAAKFIKMPLKVQLKDTSGRDWNSMDAESTEHSSRLDHHRSDQGVAQQYEGSPYPASRCVTVQTPQRIPTVRTGVPIILTDAPTPHCGSIRGLDLSEIERDLIQAGKTVARTLLSVPL
jgi:hypothetical protein